MILATSAARAQAPAALFVFEYRQGAAWDTALPMGKQPAMRAHGAYMKKLFDEGHTFAAGPTTDAPGGLVILKARDLDEARALLAADPSITAGMFAGDVHAWTPAFRSDAPLPK